MRFITPDYKFSLEIDSAIIEQLRKICVAAKTSETGGILIGQYSAGLDNAIVKTATPPPPDSKASKTWFDRGVKGLHNILSHSWNNLGTYYLGEWHFHPFSAPTPSSQDKRQMKQIANNKKYNCPEPILLIIGGNPRLHSTEIQTFVFPKGDCVRMLQITDPGIER